MSELIKPNLLNIRPIYDTQFEGMTSIDISCQTLEETRAHLLDIVSSSFTDSEKEFLISFKSGKPKWDLFTIVNAKDFPSVKWKLYNIQNMRVQKRQQALALLERKLQN